jgi:hypothetical protein
MKDYLFRIEVDNALRNMIANSLGLLAYERGPDFRTSDFLYTIEMKSRRIEKDNHNAHFSIKTRQYERFKTSAQQSFFSSSKSQPVATPNLLFMLLEYKTEIPVSEIPSELFIRENLKLESAYLVDQKILEDFRTQNKWMNVRSKDLDELIDQFGIEPMVIKKLNLPISPIGKNSKAFLKEYA